MKKWILIFCLLALVIISSAYFLLPSTNIFTYTSHVNCAEGGAVRQILDKNKWKSWWPGKAVSANTYSFKNYNYRIDKILLNGFNATLFNNHDSARLTLQILSSGIDSTELIWTSAFYFSNNPIKKLAESLGLNAARKNIEQVANNIAASFQKEEVIYGMKVVKQKVTDSSLMSVKGSFAHYPSTQEIYDMVYSLKEYIKKNGGEESNHPMLNVYEEQPSCYKVMVAIPTKQDVRSEGKFQLKKMVLGNILMGEVRGGYATIAKGEQELKNYVNDYKAVSPAIPYQLLVTDRLVETDTTKWVTRLYYPVF